jgi:hypothetical protein
MHLFVSNTMNGDQNNIETKYEYILTDIQYFGTVNWYKMLYEYSNIHIEQYEAYQKMSFRNRCMIAGSTGVINLSVPLEKGRSQKLLIKDVRISYSENWQEQHWRSICSCYGNSPFFEYYEESLKTLFSIKPIFLIDLNWQTLEWVNKRLKFGGQLSKTMQFDQTPIPPIVDARNLFKPKNYDQAENNLCYQQVFEDRIGFKPNLCILDLMFCNGPASKSLLLGA